MYSSASASAGVCRNFILCHYILIIPMASWFLMPVVLLVICMLFYMIGLTTIDCNLKWLTNISTKKNKRPHILFCNV